MRGFEKPESSTGVFSTCSASTEATNRNKVPVVLGIGYRRELAGWIDSRPPTVGCLEITAEHFFDEPDKRLRALSRDYPLFVHGLGLSLGTPGPLDRQTLENFARVVEAANPRWISEHVAFTRSSEVDLGHLNPIAPTRNMLDVMAGHIREVVESCGKPMILENVTSQLKLEGDMSEPEFLNRLCCEADCGLLLDVTNLYINARNHGFDPRQWLHEIEPNRIVQLHAVGYSFSNGRYQDLHCEAIQDDLLELIGDVCEYAPVQAVILERDAHFPHHDALSAEIEKLENACGARSCS